MDRDKLDKSEFIKRLRAKFNGSPMRPKLKAPSMEMLKSVVDAGPGEHQDRLYSLMVTHSIESFFNELHFLFEKHQSEIGDALGIGIEGKLTVEKVKEFFN